MFQLHGTRAIVTGSGRGIGRAVALALARAGADVAVNYRMNKEAASQVAREVESFGGKALLFQADVSFPDQACDLIRTVVEAWGGVDVLVNNVGLQSRASLEATDDALWGKVLASNLTAPFICAREAARHMVHQGHGRIVNMTSLVGEHVTPGYVAFTAAKGGANLLTKALAVELGPKGITVNAVAPGSIETEPMQEVLGDPDYRRYLLARTPMSRIGQPEDVAAAVLFFCSEEARWITGQTLVVDGGLRASSGYVSAQTGQRIKLPPSMTGADG